MVTYYRGRLIARPLNCYAGGSLRDRIYRSNHIYLYLSCQEQPQMLGSSCERARCYRPFQTLNLMFKSLVNLPEHIDQLREVSRRDDPSGSQGSAAEAPQLRQWFTNNLLSGVWQPLRLAILRQYFQQFGHACAAYQ